MKNDDIRKYLLQLRDILNQLILHPREVNLQKIHKDASNGKGEIHVYLIPLIMDSGFEDFLGQDGDEEESDLSIEETLPGAGELTPEITAFDKAFLKKWGMTF
ncbi:MAG: hypothetical protein HYY14_01410 [Candidatus Omnitrophica bacterium]|nr:hypothetical protein [Candidatus Omnitrophota bacterium]